MNVTETCLLQIIHYFVLLANLANVVHYSFNNISFLCKKLEVISDKWSVETH